MWRLAPGLHISCIRISWRPACPDARADETRVAEDDHRGGADLHRRRIADTLAVPVNYMKGDPNMGIYLIEVDSDAGDRDAAAALIDKIAGAAGAAGGELLEATVTGDYARAYVVVVGDAPDLAARAATAAGVKFTGPDEVRLIGATIDEVRQSSGDASYLVEWDLPAELTMDEYVARKREKSPLYANVPEVQFLRTYVREDMDKCLCLYDAGCEEDVRRARDVVSTPISRLHELGDAAVKSNA